VALAKGYLADASSAQALDVLRETKDADDPAVRLASAYAYLVADRPADAVEVLEALIEEQPTSVPARLALAKAYERNDAPAASEQLLEETLDMSPQQRAVRYARLRYLLLQPGMEETELIELQDEGLRLIAEQPSTLQSQVLRALLLFRTEGQQNLALDALRELQESAPSGDLSVLLATLYLAHGQTADAVDLLDGYVSAHPEDNYARIGLARAQLAAGDYEAAANNLVLGIEQGAQRPGLALATAWALASAGRFGDARGYFDEAEDPEGAAGPMLPHTRGLLQLGAGDARGAVVSLREALDAIPGPPPNRLRLDLANALIAADELGGARRVLDEIDRQRLNEGDRRMLSKLEARLR
jgi:predicted Zn-dependent protease